MVMLPRKMETGVKCSPVFLSSVAVEQILVVLAEVLQTMLAVFPGPVPVA